MHKVLLISFLFIVLTGFSQTIPPPYINYQAILYDVNGPNPNAPYALQSFPAYINLNDELGNLLYREEHFSSTDANGQVTIKIGDGLYLAGPITNFNQINWASGKYYLVVEFDINGSISATAPEQLVTVPYAFYAGKAGNGVSTITSNGNQTLTITYDNGTTYTTQALVGFEGPQGPTGAQGATGQSAYDLWLAQGNTGTVDDFLNASAYEIWLAQGNTGTQQDFLNTLVGPQGPQGVQGILGVQGPTGADGAQGPQGPQGATGPQGPAGVNGTNGLSAYETWLSSGNAGTEQDFMASLTGPQGPIGATGVQGPQGIAGVGKGYYINRIEFGEYNSGQSSNVTIGATCAANLVVNSLPNNGSIYRYASNYSFAMNDLVIIYPVTDQFGNPYNDAFIQANNVIGYIAEIKEGGNVAPNFMDKAQYIIVATKVNGSIPDGGEKSMRLTGQVGANGATGAAGPQGIQGIQGPQGLTGPQGPTGAVGPQGAIGQQGPAGAQGPQGIQGVQGPTGLIASGAAAGNTPYWNGTAWVTNNSNIFNNGGNVGIGQTNPTSKLEVNGAATNVAAFDAGTSSTISFATSNLAFSSATSTAFTLSNLKNGGAYSLILTSATNTGTAVFTATGFSFKYMGTLPMTSGKTHIYSFIVAGSVVYVSMATEN